MNIKPMGYASLPFIPLFFIMFIMVELIILHQFKPKSLTIDMVNTWKKEYLK